MSVTNQTADLMAKNVAQTAAADYYDSMSKNRNDPRLAKMRRERIRREKHAQGGTGTGGVRPELARGSSFASERAMRDMHALMGGEVFDNAEQANARLNEITSGGHVGERAAEAKRGDPKWQAQELAYEAMEAEYLEDALRLAREAVKLDPDCVDACRLLVSLAPTKKSERIERLRELVARAERNFGEEFFSKNAGHFWGVIETRPYMRALQGVAELLALDGQLAEAVVVYERMLELNEQDNQGARFSLTGLYLAESRPESMAALLERYPDDERHLAGAAWGRVMERWMTGDEKGARAALKRARGVNGHVEPYLDGRKAAPGKPPSRFALGSEDEAAVCAYEMRMALRAHADFSQWLRAQAAGARA